MTVAFLNERDDDRGRRAARKPVDPVADRYGRRLMAMDNVADRGAVQRAGARATPSRAGSSAADPARQDGTACARQILTNLSRRAYRRPVTAAEDDGRCSSSTTAGRSVTSRRDSVRPRGAADGADFLFRVEQIQPKPSRGRPTASATSISPRGCRSSSGAPSRTTSCSTWRRRHAADPVVFEQQVRRMLKDRRRTGARHGFFRQWLALRDLAELAARPDGVPGFDDGLRRRFPAGDGPVPGEPGAGKTTPCLSCSRPTTRLSTSGWRSTTACPTCTESLPRVEYPDDRRAGLLGQGSILQRPRTPTGLGRYAREMDR